MIASRTGRPPGGGDRGGAAWDRQSCLFRARAVRRLVWLEGARAPSLVVFSALADTPGAGVLPRMEGDAELRLDRAGPPTLRPLSCLPHSRRTPRAASQPRGQPVSGVAGAAHNGHHTC